MAKSIYQGTIINDQEDAHAQVAKQWALYEKAARLTGDILTWERSSKQELGYFEHAEDALKQELGYFEHTETATYQEHELSETKSEINYSRDCYETVKYYKPVTKEYSQKKCLKVVKHGSLDRVKTLEETFIRDSQNYYDVKNGVSSKLPSKALSTAYNVSLLLSGLFFILFFIFSPAILSDYAQSLSADILLFKLLDGYVEAAEQIPSWSAYVTFALSLASFSAFIYICSRYKKFPLKPRTRKIIYGFIIIIVAFGLGFFMNENYRESMKSNNPLLWIPYGAFCASRAIGFLTSVYFVISSVANLFTGYPHKRVAQGVERLNYYIESGEYQKTCDALQEIISSSIDADIQKITDVLVKIEEFQMKKDELIHIQETEFVDKNAEIAELDARIKKAQAKIDELTQYSQASHCKNIAE